RQILRSVTNVRRRSVSSIRFAQDNTVWVGTENGLLKLNPYNGAVLGRVNNLPSDKIMSLSADTGDKLWVGTSEGLAWVSLKTGLARPHFDFIKNIPENY
ncbi:MAG TPA: transcriptional regulator, partial [Allocoleopsis sp.]